MRNGVDGESGQKLCEDLRRKQTNIIEVDIYSGNHDISFELVLSSAYEYFFIIV